MLCYIISYHINSYHIRKEGKRSKGDERHREERLYQAALAEVVCHQEVLLPLGQTTASLFLVKGLWANEQCWMLGVSDHLPFIKE